MHTIVFICSANLCRSLIAQAIFTAEVKQRGLVVKVISAGLHDFEGMMAVREARLVCEKHKTPMPKLLSTYFRNVDLFEVTRVFGMTSEHIAHLQAETSVPPERISLLSQFDPQKRGEDIEDPTGQGALAFEQCYGRLRDCIVHYLDSTSELN